MHKALKKMTICYITQSAPTQQIAALHEEIPVSVHSAPDILTTEPAESETQLKQNAQEMISKLEIKSKSSTDAITINTFIHRKQDQSDTILEFDQTIDICSRPNNLTNQKDDADTAVYHIYQSEGGQSQYEDYEASKYLNLQIKRQYYWPAVCMVYFLLLFLRPREFSKSQSGHYKQKPLLILLSLSTTVFAVYAQFSGWSPYYESLLPKVLISSSHQNENKYYTVTGNADAIFVGGTCKESSLGADTRTAVITRIEPSTQITVWLMLYSDVSNVYNDLEAVNGLALHSDGQRVAVYALNQWSVVEFGWDKGFIFVIDANDGNIISKDVYITHSTNVIYKLLTSSHQMYFDNYDKIHFAFFQPRLEAITTMEATFDSPGVPYEAKLRIARIDASTSDLVVDYYFRQNRWFGNVGSLVFKDNGSLASSKIYIGGSSDPAHITDADNKEWSPSITMIDDTGSFEKGWRIKLDTAYETDELTHTMIALMLLKDEIMSQIMYGVIQSRDIAQPSSKLYVFLVDLIAGQNDLDTSSIEIQQIIHNPANKVLAAYLNSNYWLSLVVFDPDSGYLQYIHYDMYNSEDVAYYTLMYPNISSTEAAWFYQLSGYDIRYHKKAFIVGHTLTQTSVTLNTLSSSYPYGYVLSTHQVDSCIAYGDETEYTIPAIEMTNAVIIDMQSTLEEYEKFGAAGELIDYNSRSLINTSLVYSQMESDDWCSNSNELNITPPSSVFTLDCQMAWGEPAKSFVFSPPTLNGGCINTDNGALDDEDEDCNEYTLFPQTCSDWDDDDFTSADQCCECGGGNTQTSSLFTYGIEPISEVDYSHVRVGIDGLNSVITVETLSSGIGSVPQTLQFNAHYTAPDGQGGSFFFEFVVEDNGACTYPFCTSSTTFCADICEPDTVSLTQTIADQTYEIEGIAQTTSAFVYTVDPVSCAVQYQVQSISPVIGGSIIVFNESESTFTIQSTDSLLVGMYTVTVEAISFGLGTDFGSWQFNVSVNDDLCLDTTFTIAPKMFSTSASFDIALQAIVTSVFDPVVTIALLSSEVTPLNPNFDMTNLVEAAAYAASCPYSLEFETTQTVSFDPPAGNAGITLDGSIPELQLQTNDYAKAGNTRNYLLHVKYQDAAYSFDYTTSNYIAWKVHWEDPCSPPYAFSVPTQVNPPDYTYTGQSLPASFQLEPFIIDPVECYDFITYTCSNTGPQDMCDSSFTQISASFDQTTGFYEFYSVDMTLFQPDVYTITITGEIGSIPTSLSTTFELILLDPDPCSDPSSFEATLQTHPIDYLYTDTSPSATFTLNPFTINPVECQDAITYSCSNIGPRSDMCDVEESDSVGSFNSDTGSYEFYSEDSQEFPPGTYTFTITGSIGSIQTSTTFMLKLINDSPYFIEPRPYFIDLKWTTLEYTIEQSTLVVDLDIPLPNAVVECGTPSEMQYIVSIDKATSFVTLDQTKQSLQINAEIAKSVMPQAYEVFVQVIDECKYSSDSVKMTFWIENLPSNSTTWQFAEELLARWNLTDEDTFHVQVLPVNASNEFFLPTAEIKSMNQQGLIEIQFSTKMYTEFLAKFDSRTAEQNQTQDRRELTSSQACEPNSTRIDYFWECIHLEILEIEVKQPAAYDIVRNISFDWTVVEYANRSLVIQIEFDKAILASAFQESDVVLIKFLTDSFFYDMQGLPIKLETIIEHPLPLQMQLETLTDILTEVAARTKDAANIALSSNLVINSLLYGSANSLWSLVSSQQIIVLLPLHDIQLPPNAHIFFTQLMQVCAFDPIPMDDWWHEKLQIKQTTALSQNFETIGYDSKWFIVNLGSFAMFIAIFPLFYLLRPMLKPCSSNHSINQARKWLDVNLIWSAPIRILNESYLIMLIPAFINLYQLEWYSYGEIINSGSALLFIITAVLMPILHYKFLKQNETILHNDYKLRKKFGNLFSKYHTNPMHPGTTMFAFYFYLRRLLLALSVVMLKHFLVGQFFIFVMTLIFQIMLLGLVKPFKTNLQNKSEINSEIVTMLIMYHIFCFTDWISDVEIRYFLGLTCLALNVAHIGVNLYGISRGSTRGLFNKLRVYFLIKKTLREGYEKNQKKWQGTGIKYAHRRRNYKQIQKQKKALAKLSKQKKSQHKNELMMTIPEATAEESICLNKSIDIKDAMAQKEIQMHELPESKQPKVELFGLCEEDFSILPLSYQQKKEKDREENNKVISMAEIRQKQRKERVKHAQMHKQQDLVVQSQVQRKQEQLSLDRQIADYEQSLQMNAFNNMVSQYGVYNEPNAQSAQQDPFMQRMRARRAVYNEQPHYAIAYAQSYEQNLIEQQQNSQIPN